MEAGLPPQVGAVIDLRQVKQDQRRLMWDVAAREAWPGITVRLRTALPAGGSIRRVKLGTADLYEVESVPAEVDFRPTQLPSSRSAFISVMVQVEGSTNIRQSARNATVEPGDICLLDEACVFRMLTEQGCRIYFLRLPRVQVLGRHPQLERLFARTLPSSEPGAGLLAELLLRLGRDALKLDEAQRLAALAGIVQMLGLASPSAGAGLDIPWRICRALDFIELNLALPELTAENVAREQRISRRRLDQIMQEHVGEAISAHIRSRRLESAAKDLRNPQRVDQSIAQIAFANGFEDAAHFSRSFKRRYLVTPGQWRLDGKVKHGTI
ncbi:helix-turn-helix domain-containing protein [Alteraurantiacibacter aquimixticola]|uniref:helix-turn-helix domain-containing protein n=1 Tax=Alteraurantiacibacter aquimixticola TaxID=2489173 RepID=UPI001FEA13BC|nr:helix-turn-helix domain-containing protein [Alteraurantiacibacter aquimixticola]